MIFFESAASSSSSETGDSRVRRRALVAYGDVTHVATWSGIPYFFLKAGLRNGLFQSGISLYPQRSRAVRLLWNASRPLTLERPRGFRYSTRHLQELWDSRVPNSDFDEYVSHFPLLPPKAVVPEATSYYVDATLRQYLGEYGHRIGRRNRAQALARERDAYLSARFVICMSQWCADEVTSFYGVPSDRVRVILPGANIDEPFIGGLPRWDGELKPLRLGFIGVDWERKGGPLLVETATTLRRLGFPVEVIVIGPNPSSIPSDPAVRTVGYIDKRRDLDRFVKLVGSFHFGCLLSRAEALGISTLECLRLGVPVIGTAVGGIVDTVPNDAGLLVSGQPTSEALAEELVRVLRAPERYASMRDAARRAAPHHSWDRAARDVLALLDA